MREVVSLIGEKAAVSVITESEARSERGGGLETKKRCRVVSQKGEESVKREERI